MKIQLFTNLKRLDSCLSQLIVALLLDLKRSNFCTINIDFIVTVIDCVVADAALVVVFFIPLL